VRSGRDEAVTGYDASPHTKRIQGMAALTYSRKFAWFRPLRRYRSAPQRSVFYAKVSGRTCEDYGRSRFNQVIKCPNP
jgi:hypothetical protein